MSPELRLLAACDMADGKTISEVLALARAGGLDWGRFEALVTAEAMGGMVASQLLHHSDSGLPAGLADGLADWARSHAAAHLVNIRETLRAVAALEAAGVDAVVMKGTAFAKTLYAPHAERRYSSDVDLLIDVKDVTAAADALLAAGYRRTAPEGTLEALEGAMLLHMHNHLCFIHPEFGLEVELHHRLLLNPYILAVPFCDVLRSCCEFEIDGRRMRGLGGNILIAYLAWHALSHHGFRLKWFSDFVRAWRSVPADMQASTAAEIERLGSLQAVNLAAQVSKRIFGASILGSSDAAGGRWARSCDSDVDWIVAHIERAEPLSGGRTIAGLGREARFLGLQLGLMPEFRAKRYQYLRAMSDSRDIPALRLGPRWLGIYALLGPAFSVWRYASGGARQRR